MTPSVAPALRTRRKARHSEVGEADAVMRAMWHLRDVPVWIPVFYGGRVVGEVCGDPMRRVSKFVPASQSLAGFPYNNYDDSTKDKALEQRWLTLFSKMNSTSLVVDDWYDAWGTDVNPAPGDWSGAARTARQFTDTTTGAMYHGGAVSPKTKYVTRAGIMEPEDNSKIILLYDRVVSYDACTMTASSQAMTNTLAATRYISAGGPGLQLFVEADTVHNATGANLTAVSYTNQAGTAGQSIVTTPTLSKIVSIAAPTTLLGARCVFQIPGVNSKNPLYVPVAAGDTGMRSIQSYTWSAAPTGTCSLVMQFPLLMFPMTGSNSGQPLDYDMLSGIEAIGKRIYDDACLSFLYNARNTGKPGHIYGFAEFGWN